MMIPETRRDVMWQGTVLTFGDNRAVDVNFVKITREQGIKDHKVSTGTIYP